MSGGCCISQLPIATAYLMDAFNSMRASDKLQTVASRGNFSPSDLQLFIHRACRKMRRECGGLYFRWRSLPNPGRESSQVLTGQRRSRDRVPSSRQREPVFDERDGVVDASSAIPARGFQNLMVSFGCRRPASSSISGTLAKHLPRGRRGGSGDHRELRSWCGENDR